ncbi:hypothetical protein DID88_000708 [Monilinia fructigena]|uniref:Reverse transcriptase n=4 Tax=Monilinia fructigena TaxID=38457 RepID=A0A395IIB5_9HELO|nr:hypothetical protein DID88_000708 [Monilinia fructigena]
MLDTSIEVKGYNGAYGRAITHYTFLNLSIDGREQSFVPFLITELGSYSILLGRLWLAETRSKVDCYNRKLDWPREHPRTISLSNNLVLTPQDLRKRKIDRFAQKDADRRDEQLDLFWKKRDPRTKKTEITTIHAVEPEPTESEEPALLPPELKNQTAARCTSQVYETLPQCTSNIVDVCPITPAQFQLTCKRSRDHEVFTLTCQELDEMIDTQRRARLSEDRILMAISDFRLTGARATLNHVLAEADAEPPIPAQYREYHRAFSKTESNILPPSRPYDHKIILEGDGEKALKYSPLYKMSLEQLEVIKEYLTENLSKGFIEPSQAPFAAPTLFVRKPNGSLRFCIDFRLLNSLTRKDRYPLPLIDETLARLAGAKIYTKLDIRQAFHRIRMDPASEEYTTFRTRYGSYKCKVLPFGLTNGPATYQRYMNDVLFDYLDVFCTAYLDDILIYSENEEEHEAHVKLVLARLESAELQADLKKCEFNVKRTKYLGFIISTHGIEVDPEKVEVVESWTYPSTVKGVQSFLGFCNFYRRFIKDYGIIAKPLTELTKSNVIFHFDDMCRNAFDVLKSKLTSAPLLQHYDYNLPCMLETDASDGVIASVLSQKHGDEWLPVAYFSKTMIAAELNYEVHDKEMLSIIRSLGHWKSELAGSPHQIRIYTDHKALEYFMTTKALNARQARWAEVLADYNFIIMYRPGKDNPLADALTRRVDELDSQNKTKKQNRLQQLIKDNQIDTEIMRKSLRDDSESITNLDLSAVTPHFNIVDKILEANRTSESLSHLRTEAKRTHKHLTMESDLLLYDSKLLVPDVDNLRTYLIREAHDTLSTAHPGISKTYTLLSKQYYWRGMHNTIAQYIRNCHACKRSSAPRDRTPGLLHPLPVPQRAWAEITMDYCSFNKDKHGYDNVFVIIDRLTKQAITIPCHKEIDARQQAKLYLYHVYRYYGAPKTIVSDRGPQFISEFWKEFNRILGTDVKLSTAHHPQTDGQSEIYNQYLQQRLRPFISYYQDDWSEFLPMMDYVQLTLPHDSLGGLTPYEVLYGYPPRNAWDWKVEDLEPSGNLNTQDARAFAARNKAAAARAKENILRAQEKMSKQVNAHRRPVDFDIGDYVWLNTKDFPSSRPSKKLDFPTQGPFKIISRVGSSFRLELPSTMRIHPVFPPDKLRKAYKDPLPGQILEPPPPINITGDFEWEVEKVLAVRKARKNLQYRVSWLNGDSDLSWYPASDLKTAPHQLRDFHLANPTQPGPPAMLPEWIRLYEKGEDDYDYADHDAPMSTQDRTRFFLQDQ